MTQHPGRCGSAGWSIITQGDHKLLGLIPRWGGGVWEAANQVSLLQ